MTTCLLTIALLLTGSAALGADMPPESIHQKVLRLRRELSTAESELARVEGRATGVATPDDGKATKLADEPELSPFDKFVEKVILRRSVFDKKQITDPAEISYTHPGSGPDSYAIDAGVGVQLAPPAFFEPSAFNHAIPITLSTNLGVEYHRNSALSTLKDRFETGLRFESAIGSGAKTFGALVNGDITWVNDNVADLQDVKATLEFLPVIKALMTDDFYDIGPVRWRWAPFAGLVYDSTVNTATGVGSGHRLLGRYGAEVQIWPLNKIVGDKLELRGRYTAWTTLDSTGPFAGDDWSAYYEAGLTYWFETPNPVKGRTTAKTVAMGIGVTYVNGDDPELGLKKLDLLTLSFQAKF